MNLPDEVSVPIEAHFIAPWVIGTCEDLVLESISYGGAGRELEYSWILQQNFQICDDLPDTTLEILTISDTCLQSLGHTKVSFNVTLKVSNYLKQIDRRTLSIA